MTRYKDLEVSHNIKSILDRFNTTASAVCRYEDYEKEMIMEKGKEELNSEEYKVLDSLVNAPAKKKKIRDDYSREVRMVKNMETGEVKPIMSWIKENFNNSNAIYRALRVGVAYRGQMYEYV
ncbi:MAG: hypothetical protein ACRCX2_14080 [Paraclostridium sp.]